MKNIFEKGDFRNFRISTLNEAAGDILQHRYEYIPTIFVSHKHNELDDLKGIIGFLEGFYNVKVYIDSQDSSMPRKTSGETAQRIKERIKKCDRFILLATDGAIESKWCNWELGFGDACKFDMDSIALFPMKEKGGFDSNYKGKEYLEIYPHIVYRDGSETFTDGRKIPKGYYVRRKNENEKSYNLKPLGDWLKGIV